MKGFWMKKDTIIIDSINLGIGGYSKSVVYIGHNGLMEFNIEKTFSQQASFERKFIALACYSKHYFETYSKSAKGDFMVWTTGLMAPEAYSLHDALETYLANGENKAIAHSAALAYAKYQKCSIKAADNLLQSE